MDLLWFVSKWYLDQGLPPADLSNSTAALPPGQLAVAFRDGEIKTAHDQRRVKGQIILDDDAAGSGWYVDDDPTTDELGSEWLKGHYDLLTVLAHELGHIYGFTSEDLRFASMMNASPSGPVITASCGDHVHGNQHVAQCIELS